MSWMRSPMGGSHVHCACPRRSLILDRALSPRRNERSTHRNVTGRYRTVTTEAVHFWRKRLAQTLRLDGRVMSDILLIEDESSIRLSVSDALRDAGHQVTTASDGAEGLALATA